MIQKVYLRCIYQVLSVHWAIGGLIQLGARKGHQAIELVHTLRLVVEKSVGLYTENKENKAFIDKIRKIKP